MSSYFEGWATVLILVITLVILTSCIVGWSKFDIKTGVPNAPFVMGLFFCGLIAIFIIGILGTKNEESYADKYEKTKFSQQNLEEKLEGIENELEELKKEKKSKTERINELEKEVKRYKKAKKGLIDLR